jgi:hypothetical protein
MERLGFYFANQGSFHYAEQVTLQFGGAIDALNCLNI